MIEMYIFKKRRIKLKQIAEETKVILDSPKIKIIQIHTLRHTFATNCIEVGMDVKSLSEILGHASVEITLNKYVHSSYKTQKNTLRNCKKFLKHCT